MLWCSSYLSQSEIIILHGGCIGCYDVFHILANQKLLFPVVDTLDVISKQNKFFLDHWNTPVVSEVILKCEMFQIILQKLAHLAFVQMSCNQLKFNSKQLINK